MSSLDMRAISQLDDASRKEVAQWVENEMAQAKLRSTIHNFTEICFRKCVTSIGTQTLAKTEELCLQNCLNRFLDTNTAIVKLIQEQNK